MDEYWNFTLGEFYDCVDGYKQRINDIDYLNHILGSYVSTGVNNPKKYPKRPLLIEQTNKSSAKMTTDEQLDRFICANYNEMRKKWQKKK